MAKPRRLPNLPNARFPLIVGCFGKLDIAYPDKYPAPRHGKIAIIAVTRCSIVFKKHDVFDKDVDLKPGLNILSPKCDNGTAKYYVVCRAEILTNTHTIVVGSG